jgi:hypothetical protein
MLDNVYRAVAWQRVDQTRYNILISVIIVGIGQTKPEHLVAYKLPFIFLPEYYEPFRFTLRSSS